MRSQSPGGICDHPEPDYSAVLKQPSKEKLIGAEIRELAGKHRHRFFKGYFKLGKRAQKALELAASNFSGTSPEENLEQLAEDAGVNLQLLRDWLKVVATYSWAE